MSSVFLSHTHSDKPFARKLAADLRRNGHIVWIDEAELEIGDSLIEKIRDGIDRVDYLAAILSHNSLNSEWVKRELDIASNREIDEKRVVVLPLLLEDVQLPGFLKGKLYGDFRDESTYDESLAMLLRKLGPGHVAPKVSEHEIAALQQQIGELKAAVDQQARESRRQTRMLKLDRSPQLERAIEAENAHNPEWADINNNYAFEAIGIPVTLGYVFHAMRKEAMKGGHPIAAGIALENKWDKLSLMLEAYADFRGLELADASDDGDDNEDW